MGGKSSSSAPPPDPRLVDAQIKSMGTQESLVQQYLDLQKELTPIQKEEMLKGIARADEQYQYEKSRNTINDARAGAQFDASMEFNKAALGASSSAAATANAIAAQGMGINGRVADSAIKLNDYQQAQMKERDDRWRMVGIPQEDKLIAKVNEMGSDKYKNQQMGMAVADVNQSYADTRGQTVREMARRGMDGGGAFGAAMARGTADQALALAGTKNKTRMSLTNMDLANQFQLNGVMKGMAGAGDMSAGLATGALGAGRAQTGGGGGFGPTGYAGGGGGGTNGGSAGMGINIANSGAGGMLSGFQMGSNMAGGIGSNASSMYSSMGSYKNGQDQIAASNNPWNTMLGAAAGVGTKIALGGL